MQALRNKSKYRGVKRIFHSILYSVDGLVYAYKNEKSLLLHGILSLISIIVGTILKLSAFEWFIMLITLGLILSFELVNTGVEACVDMVTVEYNELAKIAKDACSAATFVVSIIGIIIVLGLLIGKFGISLPL